MMIRQLCIVGVLFLTSCIGPRPQAVPPYFGPTRPMSEVVDLVNKNNIALTSIWARIEDFKATLVDDKGRSTTVNGRGSLLYRKDQDLRLAGEHDLGEDLFLIGSNEEQYWFVALPKEISTMWYGSYRNLGKPCVDLSQMPIRPDALLAVLGISEVNRNFLAPPAPTMRFNNDARAYMFVWSYPTVDRWIAQREVWYDVETLLPTLVNLFDENGRVILRAYLSRHEPVEVPGLAEQDWPKMATHYDLFFPETKSRLIFQLRDVALNYKGSPNDAAFRFPANANVGTRVQLDEGCDD